MGGSNDKLIKPVSAKQYATIYGIYRSMFKQQIEFPSAENNHILLFQNKLQSRVSTFYMVHMIVAGTLTYGSKRFFGERLEQGTFRLFGEKRANLGIMLLYFGIFFTTQSFFNGLEYIDINSLANPRDMNGEVLTGIVARNLPGKLYQDRFQEMMRQKQESMFLRYNNAPQYPQPGYFPPQ